MPQVTVLINGHEYDVACGEGQERRTSELANYVDRKVKELVGQLGNLGDQRLLLLASLHLVDELWDYQEAGARGTTKAVDERRAATIDTLAERIERMAERIEGGT